MDITQTPNHGSIHIRWMSYAGGYDLYMIVQHIHCHTKRYLTTAIDICVEPGARAFKCTHADNMAVC